MINCELKPLDKTDDEKHGYICIHCNREKWSQYPPNQIALIHRPCFGTKLKGGGFFVRLTRWEKAIKRWKKAGKPIRTDEAVAALLKTCKPCPHFDDGKCGLCGCFINLGSIARFNKLRMETESCPDEPPRWQAPEHLRGILLEDEVDESRG